MRRPVLAVAISLAIHAAVVALALGYAASRGLTLARSFSVETITVDAVRELPLGPPAAAPTVGEARPKAPARPRPRVRTAKQGVTVAAAPDGGAPDAQLAATVPDAGATAPPGSRRPADLSSYGPEGSRLTALLRLDRLRALPDASAYARALDDLLMLLPDRRRLLEGTDLDLYRDFDALLVATPNPLDDTVTFLAARHKLSDEVLRAALDKAASAVGRPIAWDEQAGRPVGVRARRRDPEGEALPERDDRIFVLPEPGLAIMAPPAYAQLLVERAAVAVDAGADGGAPRRAPVDWRDLVARIDAEDGALPQDALFMMTATNLLRGRRGQPVAEGVPGGGLPRMASLVVAVDPRPLLALVAEFARPEEAARWEAEWPELRRQALANPLVLLGGFAALVGKAELSRDERTVTLRVPTTSPEMRRLLQTAANFARGAMGRR